MKTRNTKTDEARCSLCRFYRYASTSMERGECHVHAPTVYINPYGQSEYGRWPHVLSTDWCGEFVEAVR